MPLAAFLGRVLSHLRMYCTVPGISFRDLTGVLSASIDGLDVVEPAGGKECDPEFVQLELILKRQVSDLEYFESASKLRDPNRHFGLSTPDGEVWYSFTPAEFLEAAAVGLAAQSPSALTRVYSDSPHSRASGMQLLGSDIRLISWEFVGVLFVLGQIYE